MSLYLKLRSLLRPVYSAILKSRDYFIMSYRYYYYKRHFDRIKSDIYGKDRIRIVFFVLNLGMWKNDKLFSMLLDNPRFDPVVVPFFALTDSVLLIKENQDIIRHYFKEEKGFPYYDLYDFSKKEWLDINQLNPDIIFYPQPYGAGIKRYEVDALYKKKAFYYIPYNFSMENKVSMINTLLFNISVKVFAPSAYHKLLWKKMLLNKGINIFVSGYPSLDYLTKGDNIVCDKWKLQNHLYKRIIWAPHHSVLDKGVLHYSTFLQYAEEMRKIAIYYQNTVQFVFKPHPRLRSSLERHPDWGVKKTEQYYDWWRDATNTTFQDGDYYDLFLSSDAMIHDCSTFMAEYLFTLHPVMFLCKKNKKLPLNSFAEDCLEKHYKGYSVEDIKFFIETVVLNGSDTMLQERKNFVINSQLMPENKTVAQAIYDEICVDWS